MVYDLFDSPTLQNNATLPYSTHRISQLREASDASALAALVAHLQREVGRLDAERRQAAADAGQLRRQLRDAARVQCDCVPRALAARGAEITTLYRPTAGVGGDVLAAAASDEGHVTLSIADVAGHGIGAAMMAPLLERALAAEWHDGVRTRRSTITEVMRRANHEVLAQERRDGLCATAIHARYDGATRTLRFARAGHPHPVLLRAGERPQPLVSDGLLLGALPDAEWCVQEVQLQPGDRVLFYTDGLAALLATHQAASLDDRCVLSWLAARATHTPAELMADIHDRIDHAGWDTATADDVSAAVLTIQA
ncbi:MAG: serine/threonine-protein phosphatase [Phycisphaerales bacterium]|nr:serine/threonine-protein phosphatase [Phycisphaerales bacterium]